MKLASPCDNLDNLVNAIVVKNLTGEITQAGDTNLHKIRLDPYKSYLIEAIGVDGSDMLGVEEHPNLTLEDPEIPAIWNARGRSELITYGSKSDGNAIRRILRTDPPHLQDRGFLRRQRHRHLPAQGPGQQHLPDQRRRRRTVPVGRRPRGIPRPLRPAGWNRRTPGPPGRHRLGQQQRDRDRRLHHVLGDNWDSNPDEDWIGVDLQQGEEYTVRLRTKTSLPERLQATQLKILGIKDADGNTISGTASAGRRRKEGLRHQLGGPQHGPLLYRSGFSGHRPHRNLLDQHHQEVPGLTGPRLKKTKLMWASMRGRTSGRARLYPKLLETVR